MKANCNRRQPRVEFRRKASRSFCGSGDYRRDPHRIQGGAGRSQELSSTFRRSNLWQRLSTLNRANA